jgi:hypothetical protein
MYEELKRRMQRRYNICKQSEAMLQSYGMDACKAIGKMRKNPAEYKKFLDLAAEYSKADAAVWAERDRLYNAGIEYRQQI